MNACLPNDFRGEGGGGVTELTHVRMFVRFTRLLLVRQCCCRINFSWLTMNKLCFRVVYWVNIRTPNSGVVSPNPARDSAEHNWRGRLRGSTSHQFLETARALTLFSAGLGTDFTLQWMRQLMNSCKWFQNMNSIQRKYELGGRGAQLVTRKPKF